MKRTFMILLLILAAICYNRVYCQTNLINMNKETIVRLLRSNNPDDYRIGYELAIKKWHTFSNANHAMRNENIKIFYRWGIKSLIAIERDYLNFNSNPVYINKYRPKNKST